MGHNLLFALRYFLPLFLGGMIALNSCKEERASINDDRDRGTKAAMNMSMLMTAMTMGSVARNI